MYAMNCRCDSSIVGLPQSLFFFLQSRTTVAIWSPCRCSPHCSCRRLTFDINASSERHKPSICPWHVQIDNNNSICWVSDNRVRFGRFGRCQPKVMLLLTGAMSPTVRLCTPVDVKRSQAQVWYACLIKDCVYSKPSGLGHFFEIETAEAA